MDVDSLIEGAKGNMWGSALRGDFEGYVPPMVGEWLYGDPPISYLRPDEQPHHMMTTKDRLLKLRVDEEHELTGSVRFEFTRIQEGKMYDGWTGYLSSEEPYCSIFLMTDERIIVFVGRNGGDQVIEFPYDDPEFEAVWAGPTLYADGYEYLFSGIRDVSPDFMRDVVDTDEILVKPVKAIRTGEPQQNADEEERSGRTNLNKKGRTDRPEASLADLLALTPIAFEEYVEDVWRAKGYSCERTPSSGDDGIDIIAENEDRRTLIQVKRYTTQSVGIETVQRSAGLLVDNEYQADGVAIVTTSSFTDNARRRANRIDDLKLYTGNEIVKRGNDAGVHIESPDGEPLYDLEITREDILNTVGHDPLRTFEIQNELNASTQTLVALLKELADENEIKGKHIGDGHYVWYLPIE